MKRDLSKWLKESRDIVDFLRITETKRQELLSNGVEFLMDELLDPNLERSTEEIVQYIWVCAQKQFLKDLLDDIDADLDKMYNKYGKSTGSKAQLVAYEESLKQWLHSKYHYLKRKNGV